VTAVTFWYANHRGEEAVRRVLPYYLWYGSTEWHPTPQWLVRGYDLDRQAERDFAMSGLRGPWVPCAAPEDAPACEGG
jgi:predicted DNA-binding transcriptional regulator YafY